MTIEQTVEIPASRRIRFDFDVPPSVPEGRITVKVMFPDAGPQRSGNEKIHLTSQMVDEMMRGETLRSLTGILHTSLTEEEIRAERLSKYDRID